MPQFIPGLELSRRFYLEAVRPILAGHFPGLPHAAALIGPGSDVLGFDTEMSTDHDWGPRVFIFLRDVDAGRGGEIHAALRHGLPHLFHGYPVSAEESPDEPGIHHMRLTTEGPVE
ncbi:MAG: hypothetical protein M3380_14150, partial [Chloroflexota bacterium]|nr:hypothetical protein [Chloroflexota bacterium]